MNNLERNYVTDEGKEETVIATSDDEYNVRLNGGFTLANHKARKQNKLVQRFKGSILGSDVGIKSGGFGTVAILAIVLVLAALMVMYFMWRF